MTALHIVDDRPAKRLTRSEWTISTARALLGDGRVQILGVNPRAVYAEVSGEDDPRLISFGSVVVHYHVVWTRSSAEWSCTCGSWRCEHIESVRMLTVKAVAR